jgi:photosystem II stability/assembly factor-like uncharacterized protein
MNTLWIATRKGAFSLQSNAARSSWELSGPQFLGHVIHHIVQDPRAPDVMLMAAKTGHLGPTVFRSTDRGRQWKEAAQPPAFRKSEEGEAARAVERVFWLTPGHASEPGVWYAGTSPAGLFRSEDAGVSWSPVAGFNDHAMRPQWAPGAQSTPDGELMHSILIDPRDARHLYIGISSGGVFESTDGGKDWAPLNEGCEANFLPDPYPVYGHDPHCVVMHPREPDRLYQQNHCGIYRLDRPSRRWTRIGENMPRTIGDIGFPVVVHPEQPDVAWVFPMDGTEVWPRTAIDGKPAVFMTTDGGESWRRQDTGLPRSQAWFTVLRQAMCADAEESLGLYFGTTSGEVWASANAGESWNCIARHLPEIYGVSSADSGG